MARTPQEKEGLVFHYTCMGKCPPGKGCKLRKTFRPKKDETTGEGWYRLKKKCPKLKK